VPIGPLRVDRNPGAHQHIHNDANVLMCVQMDRNKDVKKMDRNKD
jgi:hypothetical protein